jgi:hypothetical protein
MEIRIPMHRIFGSQALVKRVWIRQDLGVEEVIQA